MEYVVLCGSLIIAGSLAVWAAMHNIGEYNYDEMEDPLDEAEANAPRPNYHLIQLHAHGGTHNKPAFNDADVET